METTAKSSWRDHFPEMQDNETGIYLAGVRHREGLTQRELVDQTGIPSEMENGKQPRRF